MTVQYNLNGLRDNLKFDITTGDSIVPEAIYYTHRSILLDDKIIFRAYPIEQVLSEKIQTILEKNILSTRMRDFYDVYILLKMQESMINFKLLKDSFQNTNSKRNSLVTEQEYYEVLKTIREDDHMNKLWKDYQTVHSYAININFSETIQSVYEILKRI